MIRSLTEINSFTSYIKNSVWNAVTSSITAAIESIAAMGIYYSFKKRSLADIEMSQVKFDQTFVSFPKDQMWRLFIDWKCQTGGADCFDKREPGYRGGMENGFRYLRDHLGKRLDAGDFCEIHDLCVHGVRNGSGSFQKGFSAGAKYPFPHTKERYQTHPEDSASPEAIKEAFEKGLYSGYPNHRPDSGRFLGHYDDSTMRSLSSDSPWRTTKRINKLFDHYYTTIGCASSDREKLIAIIELCTALEVYHVFKDGNQRTIAFTLLPKLLIENGFSPAILEYPHMFDGIFTTNEMVQQLRQGMERFSRVQEHYRTYQSAPFTEQIDEGIAFRRQL
jgi:hypothetical protein